MKKLLLVIPIIFGTLCTTQSFAECDPGDKKCETTRDNTTTKKCTKDSDCNNMFGAQEAICKTYGSEKRCTARVCKDNFYLWFHNGSSMGICYTQKMAENYCKNPKYCTEKDCEPNFEQKQNPEGTQVNAFTGCKKKQQNGNEGSDGRNSGGSSPRSYAITYQTNDCGNINTCAENTAPTTYTTGTGATITCQLSKENSTFNGWCTDKALQNCKTTQTIDKNATGNKTFYAKCTKQGGNNGNSDITVTITCTPGNPSCQTTDIFTQIDSFIGSKFSEKSSVWKNDDGKFNTARLASDSIAGVVLGTVGGVITSNIIKKNQIENGFEDLKCTIGGQTVASYGDEFTVGVK